MFKAAAKCYLRTQLQLVETDNFVYYISVILIFVLSAWVVFANLMQQDSIRNKFLGFHGLSWVISTCMQHSLIFAGIHLALFWATDGLGCVL